MKIRLGFVSNSSSSSFCAWGIHFENIKHDDDADFIDAMKKEFEDTPVEIIHEWENERLYLGLSYDNLKDDETGRQFKDRAEKEIKKVLKKSKYKDFNPLPMFRFYNEELNY